MIEKRYRKERWAVVLVNLIWVGAALFFIIGNSTSSDYEQRRFAQQLESCKGKFSDRYECKSALTLNRNATAFADYFIKGLVVVVPPVFLWALHAFSIKRRENQAKVVAAHHRVERVEKKEAESTANAASAAELLDFSARQVEAFLAETNEANPPPTDENREK